MAGGSRHDRDDEYEDDDRPSRRRSRDSFDDDPSYSPAPAPRSKGVSVLGVIALILGIIGLIISLIPCFGMFGIPITAIGLLLGIIGIFTSGQTTGRGLPIAGTSVSLVGLLIGIAWVAVAGVWMKETGERLNESMAEFEKQAQVAEAKRVQDEKELREGKAIVLLATKLDDDYDKNRLSADTKYKGKVLELTGTVRRVDRDRLGNPWIEFETDSDAIMKCEFSKSSGNELARVEVDKTITIRGRCKGKSRGRDGDDEIVLENCLLTKSDPTRK